MSDHSLRLIVPDSTLRRTERVRNQPCGAGRLGRTSADGAHLRSGPSTVQGRRPNSRASDAEPDARFNCLETIRPPAHYICARLDRTACRRIGRRRRSRATRAIAAEGTGTRLQGGRARRARSATQLTDTTKDLLGHAMHRTAADLSCALLRTYEFYTDAPPRAWYELNQLYRLADELGIASNAYADEQSRGAGHADDRRRLSAHRAAGRREAESTAPEGSVRRLQRARSMDAAHHDRRAGRRYDVRRRSRRRSPPSYRELGSHTGGQLRGIRTDVLVYELEAYLAEMASDVPVPDYIGPDLLRHLAHAWGVMKKRSFRRSRSSGPMKICVGSAHVALLHLWWRRVRRPTRHHRSAAAARDQSVHSRRRRAAFGAEHRATSGTMRSICVARAFR